MATITININDGVAKEFREEVMQSIGQRKGALGKAIEEAIKQWLHEKKQKQIAKEMIELMEEGIAMGKIKIKSRGELYER